MRVFWTLKGILKRSDPVLLALCLVTTIFGLVLIASATNFRDNSLRYVAVQGAAMMIGVVLYCIFASLDMEHFAQKWWVFLLFNLGFIALLIPFGVVRNNSRAWLSFSWLPMDIQPAEIVKLTFTILLAKQMAWFRDNRGMKGLESLFWPVAHTGMMFLWIYLISSDAGSGLVYLMIFIGMAFAAGLAWYWFAIGVGAVGTGVLAMVGLDLLPPYMTDRIWVLFDHGYKPLGVGWQQTRSLMALGSGGLFGQGLFNGIQTQSKFKENLPERQTDFIFSVCGEELGMVGCLAIIVLEFLLVWRCFQTAKIAKSSMGSLICIGFGTMLIFQTVENIGMCLFVMPVIGLTLPFVSYGGSSIVTLYAAMGIVAGVRRHTLPDWLRKT